MENKKRFFLFRISWWFKFASIFSVIALLLSYLSPFVHPITFWPIAFFGLAYPIFIVVALFFLILFTLRKSKMAILFLIVILLGGKLHFRHFVTGLNASVKKTENTTLNVMSYNVRLFDFYNWNKADKFSTRDGIFSFLRQEQPEVVCFQEFYSQDAPSKFITKDSIFKILCTDQFHSRSSHKIRLRQNFGVALYSKYPIISKGEVSFPNNPNNYCIYSDVVKFADTFRVYNVHLQSIKFQQRDYDLIENNGDDLKKKQGALSRMIDKLSDAFPARVEQAQRVIEHAKTSPYATIICGDFNDTPLSYTYNLFNKDFTDAFRNSGAGLGWTYAGKIPAGRIDYIFHCNKLNSYDFRIQSEKLSDHYAIMTKIEKLR